MAQELRVQATSGRITWAQAAESANNARNAVMEMVRSRSTPVGLAMAERLKREGKTLNELMARKAQQLFGPSVEFSRLPPAQQNAVYAEIVKSAGKSNPRVTAAMRQLSKAGRGLLVLSVAMSVYAIATDDNKTNAVKRELALTGSGVGFFW